MNMNTWVFEFSGGSEMAVGTNNADDWAICSAEDLPPSILPMID